MVIGENIEGEKKLASKWSFLEELPMASSICGWCPISVGMLNGGDDIVYESLLWSGLKQSKVSSGDCIQPSSGALSSAVLIYKKYELINKHVFIKVMMMLHSTMTIMSSIYYLHCKHYYPSYAIVFED